MYNAPMLTLRHAHVGAMRTSFRTMQAMRVQCAAGKGFGSNTNQKKAKEEPSSETSNTKMRRANKSKGKVQRRLSVPTSQPQQPAQQQFDLTDSQPTMSLAEEVEFEQRLKALAEEAERKKQEIQAAQPGAGGILDTKRTREQEDIYSNPPPLTKTLFAKEGEKGEEGSGFGPGQVGLAVTSLALVGVFILTGSGSDLQYMLSPVGAPAQQAEQRQVDLGEEQRKDLEAQLAAFKEQLEAAPDSSEALEGVAVINARLGNFKEAVEQLQQLSAAKPNDPDVWRVLAESQSALGDRSAAIASYRRAWQEVTAAGSSGPAALEVLQSLAGELVAAGQQQQAVDLVKEAAAVAAPPAAGDAPLLLSGRLGSVEAQLLLGKVYSQWRGHTADALAVYDALTESQPNDFRGFLAKGLLLRDQGRQADAQRAFIQARYLAPKETRPVVDGIINRQQ